MDLKNTANAARLLYDCMIKGKTDFARLPFKPSKTALFEKDAAPAFRRISPARAGLDGKKTLALLKAFSEDVDAGVHTALLLKDGKEVFSAARAGYDVRLPHAAFSFSKTVLGLAIGMLRDEGKLSLDTPIHTFFPEYRPIRLSRRMRAVTVRHLLTMTSGVIFGEAGAVVEENWIKGFFESGFTFAPGTAFAYNSMNSYMLSAILTRVTKTSLTDYLTPRLFAPMGINAFWEKCPMGIEKGGWGLYLSTESMAKLGQLILDRGVYRGVRIVSEEWIAEATSIQCRVPASLGAAAHYGYHIWVYDNGYLLLNGMFGQNTLVCPKEGIVFSVTSGNDHLFHSAPALALAVRGMSDLRKKKSLLPHPLLSRALRREEKRFGEESGWLSPYSDGREAAREKFLTEQGIFGNHSVSKNNTGLLPLLTRLVQNNHSAGLSALSLARVGKSTLSLTFTEGEERYTVLLGEKKHASGVIRVKDEPYRVSGAYDWGKDEHRAPALRVSIVFPELASSRMLLFRMRGEALTLSLFERPGFVFLERLIRQNGGSETEEGGIIAMLLEKIDLSRLMMRAESVFSPTLRLGAPREASHALSNTPYDLPESVSESREEESEDLFSLDENEDAPPHEGFLDRLLAALGKKK